MSEKKQAVVKWFNPKAGYGFLTDLESQEDIFCHHKGLSVSKDVYRTLTPGEYVQYQSTSDQSGKTLAENVTGIGGGPLLCERPRPARKAGPKTEDAVEE
tara:strand:+ start:364 stop:663 length:300 start_codon:yes stop_codon:yes gene_type:complete